MRGEGEGGFFKARIRPEKKGVVGMDGKEMQQTEPVETGFQVTEEELAEAIQMVLEGRLSN